MGNGLTVKRQGFRFWKCGFKSRLLNQLLILLVPLTANAFGPSEDLCGDEKCRAAVSHIERATLQMVGFNTISQQFNRYVEDSARERIKELGIEKEVAVGIVILKIYKDGEINTYLFKQRVRVGLDHVYITINL